MLKSDAARVVLVGVLAIAAFELGLSGKFGKLWSLAFVGDPSKSKSSGKQKPPPPPPAPPVVIA